MSTVNAAAPRLPRANTEPLPNAGQKPGLQRSPTAPASLSAPKPEAKPAASTPKPSGDSFTPAKASPSKLDSAKDLFGKASKVGGLAGGLFGIGNGIKGLVDDVKGHKGAHDIAGDAIVTGKGVLGAVKGGLETASLVGKGAEAAGKAAGRFVPGLNIGIAAMDAAQFANNMTDPKATLGDKITSGITAAGSAVAATEIPIASQIGAGVSFVSSMVGAGLHLFG